MATRKHSLLAANRKNMGLIEDAYSETQAFNDPVVQRRKMFGHMADTTKEVYGGWKKIKESAQDYYTSELQKNPPKRPDNLDGITSEDDDLADDLTIEETGLDNFDAWDPLPLTPEQLAEQERLRKLSVGSNPAASNIVTSSQGTGPTSYSSTRNTLDLSIFTPTQENVNDLVSFAVTGQGPVSYQSRDERKSLLAMTKDFFRSQRPYGYDPNYEWKTGHGYVWIGEGEEQ
tara:strand:+ start:3326 stop:4018 length:693 start_codon:yes stop_codon:yes gene_type:complete